MVSSKNGPVNGSGLSKTARISTPPAVAIPPTATPAPARAAPAPPPLAPRQVRLDEQRKRLPRFGDDRRHAPEGDRHLPGIVRPDHPATPRECARFEHGGI